MAWAGKTTGEFTATEVSRYRPPNSDFDNFSLGCDTSREASEATLKSTIPSLKQAGHFTMVRWTGLASRAIGCALIALVMSSTVWAQRLHIESVCDREKLFVDGAVPDITWQDASNDTAVVPIRKTCWLRVQRPDVETNAATKNDKFLVIENSWGSDIFVYSNEGKSLGYAKVNGVRFRSVVDRGWVYIPVDAETPQVVYVKLVSLHNFSTVKHTVYQWNANTILINQGRYLQAAASGWLLFSAAIFSLLIFLYQRNRDYLLFSAFAFVFSVTMFLDRGELAPFGWTGSSNILSLSYPLSGLMLAWVALRVGRLSVHTPWTARAIVLVIALYGSLAAWQIAILLGIPLPVEPLEPYSDYVYNLSAILQLLIFWGAFQAWRKGDRPGLLISVGIAPLILFEIQISNWFESLAPGLSSAMAGFFGSSLRISSYWLLPMLFFVAIAYRARKVQQDAIRLAQQDHLTDLHNRDHFLVLGQSHLNSHREAVLLAISIERLKAINNVLGFQVGDAVIVQVAQRLASIGEGILARVQTNQFCLLLEDQARVSIVRQKLENMFMAPVIVEGQSLDVALSIGTASGTGLSMVSLLRNADVALGAAKANNANWVAYDVSMATTKPETLSLLSDLARAIGDHELRLFLQPKVRLSDGVLTGAEALVRWQHPTRGMVPPNEFIPFAEQTGKISPLTMWVIREGAQLAQQLRDEGRPIVVSVNISTNDLRGPDFVERAIALVNSQDANTSDLRLELTESGMMEDPQTSLKVLHALRDAGFSLSIDDFGTGYSSLSYLQKMPVAELKIDQSFVQSVHAGSDGAELLDSIIALGHRMGLSVVAEGAETKAEFQLLQSLGCDNLQGWFVAKAMPIDDFIQWRNANDPFNFGGSDGS